MLIGNVLVVTNALKKRKLLEGCVGELEMEKKNETGFLDIDIAHERIFLHSNLGDYNTGYWMALKQEPGRMKNDQVQLADTWHQNGKTNC